MSNETEGKVVPLVENAAVPQLLPIDLTKVERELLTKVLHQTNYAGEHCGMVFYALNKVVSHKPIEFTPPEYDIVLWSVNSAQFSGEVLEVATAVKIKLVKAIHTPS